MLTFCLPFLSLLLLFTTTTTIAQPYNATDHFLLDCSSSTTSPSGSIQRWDGDEHSKFLPSDFTATSFSSETTFQDPSVPTVPYSTARIINTSFTYNFQVSKGPKFLRLYFYPATYSALFLAKTRSDAGVDGPPVPHFVKEFLIYVKDTQFLNVVFTPVPNSYAFINGIEIVSMPDNLYFDVKKNPKPVGMSTGPVINNKTALETVYRLNVGGREITGNDDTGMFRSWNIDDNYIYGAAVGQTPIYQNPITYTVETPNYTAPEPVYQTQRSMGDLSDLYNLTWILPVDSGFYYMLRLHFCNIIPQYTKKGQIVFTVFINNQTAEEEADLFYWTQGSGYPVYKDYVVFVNSPDGHKSKQDLWLAVHPNPKIGDGYLNGLEAFKLSMNGNLSSSNPELSSSVHQPPRPVSPIKENKKKNLHYVTIIGGVGACVVLLSVLLCIVLRQRTRLNHHGTTNQKPSRGSTPSDLSLPSDRSRHFTLAEVKAATNNFNENCVIGNGGFGNVYKGYIDNAATTVAIKRLNPSSSQGFYEFHTEIEMLSKLRHVHLVSLIGYCDENGEMVLVYDYMTHGTLREHLYKTNNPLLSWETRLNICIGAAKGLHYLHTDEQVNLAEWGKTCYRRGALLEIIDEKLRDQIAPGCLRKFGEVANSCLHQEGGERPAMDEVVWGLEFALEL
ncbi:protein kinase domain-containing protein [Artemisia annua]|uniref:Protein kinase domain-containing protein n=1 Tax=Artemisia annua TaxID=35608 RepID=A0A2U1KA78_ARTAN|nr:protein kinase domain-containing protein [Artemisia annua]